MVYINLSGKSLFSSRNFRLLVAGEGISTFGDQFTLIALPWLVLKTSDDPAVLGVVMALASVPRALLMLVGGAVSDRFSPKSLMLVANNVRFALVLAIGLVALAGTPPLIAVGVFALLFGVADAFFIPAQRSIIPHVVEREEIGAANSTVQGVNHLCQFAGPFAVGALISLIENGRRTWAVGLAFLFDAATFLISIVTLALIRTKKIDCESEEPILQSIKSGLASVWKIASFRYMLFAVAGVNFFLVGPFMVGVPVLAESRLGGAMAYGIVSAMMGIGVFIGFVLGGILPKASEKKLGHVMMALFLFMGVMLAGLGIANTVYLAAAFTLLMSVANGYVTIIAITVVQQSFEVGIMGRIMSVITLCGYGLLPISMAISGAALRYGTSEFFVACGLFYVLWVGVSWAFTPAHRLGVELAQVRAQSEKTSA